MFRDAREEAPINWSILTFALRRLGQLGDDTLAAELLDDLAVLYPTFPDIIRYLKSLRHLDRHEKAGLGARVLALLEGSIVSELEYHRLWALDLFADSTDWDNSAAFVKLLEKYLVSESATTRV
jgi:hypothetical protein